MGKLKFSSIMLFFLMSLISVAYAADPVINSLTGNDVTGGEFFKDNVFAFEDLQVRLDITANDADNDTLTLTATNLPSGAVFNSNPAASVVTGTFTWTPDDTGEEDPIIFSVNDGTTTVDMQVRIVSAPELCEEGPVGDLKIKDIDFDEDEYLAGDDVDVDVEVENDFSKDLDVVVEGFIYNIDEDNVVDDAEADEQEVEENEEENFDLSMSMPLSDEDLNEGDELIFFVKAFEDGDEEDHCAQELRGESDFEFIREKDDVVIERVLSLPSVVNPGEVVRVSVDILNVGDKDQDDVTVELRGSELDILMVSERVDLDRAGDKDEDATVHFDVTVPTDTSSRDYSFTVTILDEDDDPYDRGDDFFTVKVTGESEVEVEEPVLEIPTTTITLPMIDTPEEITGSAVRYFPTFGTQDTLVNVFWIIANIVLLVLIAYFVKLIFFKK